VIEGRRPNGYLVSNGDIRIERETRQCVHCQFTWVYSPHAEAAARNIRGFCLRCYGFTCERPECHAEQAGMLRDLPGRPCISFWEHYQRRLEQIAKSPHFEVTPAGLIRATDDPRLALPR
jgi:hypothetical protein